MPSTASSSSSSSSAANVVGVPKGAYRKIIQKVVDPCLTEYYQGQDQCQDQDQGQDEMEKGATENEHPVKRSDATSRVDVGEGKGDEVCTTVMLSFSLPAGSFATALLRELTNNDDFI